MDEKKISDKKDFSNVTFEDHSEEYSDFHTEKKIKNEEIIKEEHIVKKTKIIWIIAILVTIVLTVVTVKLWKLSTEKKESKNYTHVELHAVGHENGSNAKSEENGTRSEEENTRINNNLGYANVSGLTVAEWCDKNDMTFEKFKESFCLPENITKDTYYDVAYYMMPVAVIAKIENTDFNTLKERYKIPDVIELQVLDDSNQNEVEKMFSEPQYKKYTIQVNENTPWGIIYDELLIENCIEDSFEVFKAEYGLGDEITPQTKMKEVRPVMEKVKIENRDKKENNEEQTSEESIPQDQPVTDETEISQEVPTELVEGAEVPVSEETVQGDIPTETVEVITE